MSFMGILSAGGLFFLTLIVALLVYWWGERKRKASSFFSSEFLGNFIGVEALFCVLSLAVGLMVDVYELHRSMVLVLVSAGLVGQYYLHKIVIRWAHQLAGQDRFVKGTHHTRTKSNPSRA